MDWTCILYWSVTPLMFSCRCSKYPDFIMQCLQQKVTLSRRRDHPHWSVEETIARGFQEPVWSNGDGWYWTQSQGWFELIARTRSKGAGATWGS